MPRYVIHVGPHKTGSTYLQASFAQHQADLSNRGIIYPGQWRDGNQASHVALFRRLRGRDPGLAVEFATLNDSPYKIVLISSEAMADLKLDELAFLRELLGGASVEIIFYCRRWSELLLSGWQEMVKHGYIRTFPEFLSAHLMNPFATHVMNFQITFDKFIGVFGAEGIHLVSYNFLIDQKIDLFEHFARTFLDWRDPPPPSVGRPNASLGPVDSEMLRVLHALEWTHSSACDPSLYRKYIQAKEALDIGALVAAMERDLRTLNINEDAPGLRLLHRRLFKQYGERLVEPRSGELLFAPTRAQLPFVGQNYLLAEGVVDAIERIYNQLRGPTSERSP
jgi:hypothetical protein